MDIINPRGTIINAILHTYQEQSQTLEGSKRWESTSGRKSKLGQAAVQQLIKTRHSICKISGNKDLQANIKNAAQNLLDHLQNLTRTYEKVLKKE